MSCVQVGPYYAVERFLDACAEPEKYNFEFECGIDEYMALETPIRYLTYKATGQSKNSIYAEGRKFVTKIQENEKYKQLVDCDGSGGNENSPLIHAIYAKLWGWKPSAPSALKAVFSCKFGADTMNSVQFVLNDILKNLLSQEAYQNLLHKKLGKFSINYLIALYANEACRQELLAALKSVSGLFAYLDAYHTIGNFVLVPSGFNAGRASLSQDYWDLSLRHLKENGWGTTFRSKKEDSADYYRYINYFFLWDYVDIDGNPLFLLNRGTNTIASKEEFLKKATRCINRRGCFLVTLLRLEQQLGAHHFAALRESVFAKDDAVYASFKDVFFTIECYLKRNNLYSSAMEALLLKQVEPL